MSSSARYWAGLALIVLSAPLMYLSVYLGGTDHCTLFRVSTCAMTASMIAGMVLMYWSLYNMVYPSGYVEPESEKDPDDMGEWED